MSVLHAVAVLTTARFWSQREREREMRDERERFIRNINLKQVKRPKVTKMWPIARHVNLRILFVIGM